MSYEEKDWIMRQIKQLAMGLGRILGKDSLKEMINLELSASEKLSDDEIEQILLIIEIEDRLNYIRLTEEEMQERIGIDKPRLEALYVDYTLLTKEEDIRLRRFLDEVKQHKQH
ncbi:MAG: hypothetical protein RR554_05145 [Vagococcus sp.]|uniref:hypothetical protein n=1 Tax=Vagococcus sp. TaxID=1933889 RepID=UPI002FC6EDCA